MTFRLSFVPYVGQRIQVWPDTFSHSSNLNQRLFILHPDLDILRARMGCVERSTIWCPEIRNLAAWPGLHRSLGNFYNFARFFALMSNFLFDSWCHGGKTKHHSEYIVAWSWGSRAGYRGPGLMSQGLFGERFLYLIGNCAWRPDYALEMASHKNRPCDCIFFSDARCPWNRETLFSFFLHCLVWLITRENINRYKIFFFRIDTNLSTWSQICNMYMNANNRESSIESSSWVLRTRTTFEYDVFFSRAQVDQISKLARWGIVDIISLIDNHYSIDGRCSLFGGR